MSDRLEIAVVVVRRGDRLLVRRRREGEHLSGLWEFPGGKIRPGESPSEAALREAREEMRIEAKDLEPREVVDHDYPERRVRLHFFEGTCAGEPDPPDGAVWAWVAPVELASLPIPEANRALVARLLAGSSKG